MPAFEPRVICRSFKFKGHEATDGMTLYGKVVLTDDGLMLLPRSKQSANAVALSHAFGLVGALIAQFMKSVKQIEWPFPAIAYRDVAQQLQLVPTLRSCKPDQQILIVHKHDIVGFHSSFWKGLTIRTTQRVAIVLIGSRRKSTRLLEDLGFTRLER